MPQYYKYTIMFLLKKKISTKNNSLFVIFMFEITNEVVNFEQLHRVQSERRKNGRNAGSALFLTPHWGSFGWIRR